MKKILALLAFVIITSSNALLAQGTASTKPRTSEVYATNKSASDVEKAIIAAATSLDWMTKKGPDGDIEARLLVRTHELTITITFSASEYTITYKDSKNLNYNAKKQTIHGNAGRWLNNLDVAIKREIAR